MIATLAAVLFLCLMIFSIYRRRFLEGIICGLVVISTSIIALLQLIFKVAEGSELGELVVLLIVYGMIPLIFIGFCIWLMFNSKMMRTREGKSFTAKLALLLGVNLIIVVPGFFYLVSSFVPLPTWMICLLTTFCLIDIFFTFLFIAYLFYSFLYQMIPVRKTIHYIIILGASVRSEEVTPLLRSRLDKAIEYQKKQTEKIKFVVSEGQGPDEPVSEAFAMRKYLLSQHIPDEQILFEDQSTTTLENMRYSKAKIVEDWQGEDEPVILFSTSNYHVLRGAIYARKANVKAEGVGAPVAMYFLPTALIREYIALIVRYKGLTIAVVVFIILLVIATYLPLGRLVA